MSKNILYLAIIMSSSLNIWMMIRYNHLKETMTETQATRNTVIGKQIGELPLLETASGNETSLFAEMKGQYSAIFLTSINVCSLCREREASAWFQLAQENPSLNVFFVAAEPHQMSRQEIVKAKSLLEGFAQPIFADTNGSLLLELGLQPDDTPIVMVVNNTTGRIISADQPTPDSSSVSDAFRQNFLREHGHENRF